MAVIIETYLHHTLKIIVILTLLLDCEASIHSINHSLFFFLQLSLLVDSHLILDLSLMAITSIK